MRKALVDAFDAAPASTFAPIGRETVASTSIAAVCSVWPSTPRPEVVPVRGPDVPVLVLAGREDLRTPLEDARRTASQYPNATVLAVPGVGHSVLGSDASGCASTGITAFLAGAPIAKCARRLELPAAPFIPASLNDLRPARGLSGAAGRVATAVDVTLLDFVRSLVSGTVVERTLRVPGLRGGSLTISRAGIRLRDYEVVRGVQLSGQIGERSGTLTVRAPGGLTGVLTTSRTDRERGTIGGQRVSFVSEHTRLLGQDLS